MIPALPIAGVSLALAINPTFALVLSGYYTLTIAYSLILKRISLVDVITLASLYTLRIIGGAVATDISASYWLLVFSMFIFFSLAQLKRFTELARLAQQKESGTPGRGYILEDSDTLAQFGAASGCISVLVLALYISNDAVTRLYDQPQVLWLLCPILLYVINRMWMLARRGMIDDDPIVFVTKDRRSQMLAVVASVLLWIST